MPITFLKYNGPKKLRNGSTTVVYATGSGGGGNVTSTTYTNGGYITGSDYVTLSGQQSLSGVKNFQNGITFGTPIIDASGNYYFGSLDDETGVGGSFRYDASLNKFVSSLPIVTPEPDLNAYQYGDLSTNIDKFNDASTAETFNAYTINKIHSRVYSIENTGTKTFTYADLNNNLDAYTDSSIGFTFNAYTINRINKRLTNVENVSGADLFEFDASLNAVKCKYPFYSNYWVSAGGMQPGSSSGSQQGSIDVLNWNDIDDYFSNDNVTQTFNAYTIQRIWNVIKDFDPEYWGIDYDTIVTGLGYIPADASTVLTNITSSTVTNALGFTPYNASNPAGYITGIDASMIEDALGYLPGQGGSGSSTELDGSTVIGALGFTPYDSANPMGYLNSYDFKTINNQSIIGSGNITINVNTSDLESDISDLNSRITSNTNKINDVSARVKTNTDNISNLSGKIADISARVADNSESQALSGKINDVSTRVAQNTSKINDVSARVKTNTDNISNLTEKIADISARVADNSELQALSGKVNDISARVAQNTTNIANNTTKINDVSARVGNVSGNISDVSTRVAQNTSKINDVSARVAQNTSKINDVSARVASASNNISDISTRVAQNTASINTINTNVSDVSSRVANNSLKISDVSSRVASNSTKIEDVSTRVYVMESNPLWQHFHYDASLNAVYSDTNFYSMGWSSAGGIREGTDTSSGSGNITVHKWDDLYDYFSDDNDTATFNAYTIRRIWETVQQGGSAAINYDSVVAALGYVPADASTIIPNLDASTIISILGYTPYDASNPAEYVTDSDLSGYAKQSYVIDRVDRSVGSLKTYVDNSIGALKTHLDASLAAFDASVSALDTSLGHLRDWVSRNDASLTAVSTTVSQHDTSITNLDSSVSAISQWITTAGSPVIDISALSSSDASALYNEMVDAAVNNYSYDKVLFIGDDFVYKWFYVPQSESNWKPSDSYPYTTAAYIQLQTFTEDASLYIHRKSYKWIGTTELYYGGTSAGLAYLNDFKTINHQSIIGSGDISIGGGSGGSITASDISTALNYVPLGSSDLKTINNQSIVGSGNISITSGIPTTYVNNIWVGTNAQLASITRDPSTLYITTD